MAHSLSFLLRDAYMGNPTALRGVQVLGGLTNEEAARLCLVSPETFRRWRSDRPANPTAVRLLAVHAGYLPWRGWDGWEMHNGLLFPPGATRRGILPSHIEHLPILLQLLNEYRRGEDRPDGLQRAS